MNKYKCDNKEEATEIFNFYWDRKYTIDYHYNKDYIKNSTDANYPMEISIDDFWKTIDYKTYIESKQKINTYLDFKNHIRNLKFNRING